MTSRKPAKPRAPSKAEEERAEYIRASVANAEAARQLRAVVEELPARLSKAIHPDRGIHAWQAKIQVSTDGNNANVYLKCAKCEYTTPTNTFQMYAGECPR